MNFTPSESEIQSTWGINVDDIVIKNINIVIFII